MYNNNTQFICLVYRTYIMILIHFFHTHFYFSFFLSLCVHMWIPFRQTSNEPIPITINKISMTDYETHHYDNELLRQSATFLATIKFNTMTDLEQIRKTIESYCEENANTPKLLPDWCFLDCK